MNKILYMFILVAAASSCASSYNVQGSSSISALDGSKLYLKALKDSEVKNIDSCEEGDITIKIDNASQSVGGTPLNDSLYKFIDKHNQLSNRMNELSHRQSQMLLDGIDEMEIDRKLSAEANAIAAEEDELVTKFVINNFDNVLGPGVFMMITSQYRFPVLTPQIEDIMSKATDKFKNDPYVKDYYKTAQENEARMNGMNETVQPQADTMPSQPATPLTNVPEQK